MTISTNNSIALLIISNYRASVTPQEVLLLQDLVGLSIASSQGLEPDYTETNKWSSYFAYLGIGTCIAYFIQVTSVAEGGGLVDLARKNSFLLSGSNDLSLLSWV